MRHFGKLNSYGSARRGYRSRGGGRIHPYA